jgi:hypothetical protein
VNEEDVRCATGDRDRDPTRVRSRGVEKEDDNVIYVLL